MQTTRIKKGSDLSLLSKNTERETDHLTWEYITYNVLVYIHFFLSIKGYLPLWSFCVMAPMYISRWMISFHELLHIFKPKNVNLLIRHNLLIATPFYLGYREIRDIHMRHHAYTLTDKDPDLYHIRGSLVSSIINVFFYPERSTYNWVCDKGFDRELVTGMAIRFILFVGIVWWLGWMSLWYFIPVRISIAASMFLISYNLHRHEGAFGTYTANFGTFMSTVFLIGFGRATLETLSHHDIHHDYPKISALKLSEARRYYTPRDSSLAPVPNDIAYASQIDNIQLEN